VHTDVPAVEWETFITSRGLEVKIRRGAGCEPSSGKARVRTRGERPRKLFCRMGEEQKEDSTIRIEEKGEGPKQLTRDNEKEERFDRGFMGRVRHRETKDPKS